MPGAFHAENASSSCILGAPQEPLTFNPDPLPNEPAQPGPPVRDPAISPIQTIQTYLTHQAQTVQSNLTAILPGLIQEEVRIQCAQVAKTIDTQISSLREEVVGPTGDPDDPMLPSGEEGENEGSRGHGKRSARHSYNKRKGKEVRFAAESDSEVDEANEDDEGGESEGDEGDEGIRGSRKHKKKIPALRVSNYYCSQ